MNKNTKNEMDQYSETSEYILENSFSSNSVPLEFSDQNIRFDRNDDSDGNTEKSFQSEDLKCMQKFEELNIELNEPKRCIPTKRPKRKMWKNSRRDSQVFAPESPLKLWKLKELETVFETSEPTPMWSKEKCISSLNFKGCSQIEANKMNLESEFKKIDNNKLKPQLMSPEFDQVGEKKRFSTYNNSPIVEHDSENKENIDANKKDQI